MLLKIQKNDKDLLMAMPSNCYTSKEYFLTCKSSREHVGHL